MRFSRTSLSISKYGTIEAFQRTLHQRTTDFPLSSMATQSWMCFLSLAMVERTLGRMKSTILSEPWNRERGPDRGSVREL